jgi:predicted nucleic acid-binding protein
MLPPVCVDASVVVRLLVPAPGSEAVAALWSEWTATRRRIVTSGLVGYEVTNALLRYEVLGALSSDDVNDALSIFASLNLVQVDDPVLHAEALKLARTHGLKAAYDAHYLATARRFAADLFTADARLARAVDLPFVKLVS